MKPEDVMTSQPTATPQEIFANAVVASLEAQRNEALGALARATAGNAVLNAAMQALQNERDQLKAELDATVAERDRLKALAGAAQEPVAAVAAA